VVIPDELNDFDAARATRASVDDVRSWRDGRSEPGTYAIERLRDVARTVELLEGLGLNDSATRGEWLRTQNKAFAHDAPLDVVARGDYQQIADYIEKLG
jgi:hypothetical protein